tara:strand:+ start:8379 stop:8651 length:273 start_codon:yes stop_codon:yes gene_type:complete
MIIYRVLGEPVEDIYRDGVWNIEALIKEEEQDKDSEAYVAIISLNDEGKAWHITNTLKKVIGPLDVNKELDQYELDLEEGENDGKKSYCI